MSKIKLAIEEEFDAKGYKSIHKAGCRDLRDPERVEATDLDDLVRVVEGYEVTAHESPEQDRLDVIAALAPCAKRLLIP